MSILSFFKKSSAATPQPQADAAMVGAMTMEQTMDVPQSAPQSTPETPTEPVPSPAEPARAKQGNIVTIHYGTGMAIDSIYAFISKDYEQDGYQDAIVNCAAEYCKAKENIILNSLQQLFSQVLLRYKKDIRLLDVQIENAKSLFSLNYAAILEARKDTCEEHIQEINNMKAKLLAKEPEMMTMIESYRRGFSKGCVAQTTNFLSSTHADN